MSAPWRTVQHAFDYARAGETVCFRGGTYPMTNSSGYNQILSHSGTASSRITFANYPGEVAVIEGSTRIEGAYITFQGTPVTAHGLVFAGPGAPNMDLIDLLNSHDVTLDHVEIRHGDYHAGLYQYGGYNIAVTGCYIHDNGRPGYINTDQGIYWDATTGGGNLIANNVIDHNVAMGVQLYPAPTNVVVEENTIVNNGNYGIVVYGSEHKIVNNILSNNGDSANNSQMKIDLLATLLTIDSNIFWNANASQEGYWDLCDCHSITRSILKDPLFISSYNYELQTGSPAINTGNSSYSTPRNIIGLTRSAPPNRGSY